MATSIKIKRGTRAQISSAASSGALKAGEPYLITDEGRFAVGLSSNSFEPVAKQSEIPVTGDVDYGLVTGSPQSTADYGGLL